MEPEGSRTAQNLLDAAAGENCEWTAMPHRQERPGGVPRPRPPAKLFPEESGKLLI